MNAIQTMEAVSTSVTTPMDPTIVPVVWVSCSMKITTAVQIMTSVVLTFTTVMKMVIVTTLMVATTAPAILASDLMQTIELAMVCEIIIDLVSISFALRYK